MLIRLISSQTLAGSVPIYDIEDGMPRAARPSDGSRDFGYMKKQSTYVPQFDATNPSLPGHIDLVPTGPVLMSIASGQIAGQVTAGYLLAPIYISPGTTEAPTISSAALSSGNLTITGTIFQSIAPYKTSVIITGPGAVTLTQAQIISGSGTISETSVYIPAALIPGVTSGSSVTVNANNQSSNTVSA
jgi:hypothetical protein